MPLSLLRVLFVLCFPFWLDHEALIIGRLKEASAVTRLLALRLIRRSDLCY